jgi:uncharacterized protein (TIGR02266 family)
MTDERRSGPRARTSGARVTYESASGDHVETDALNIGRGGLFISAAKPLAVGKRITLEIQIEGEPVPGSALGRVIWVRAEADGPQRPSGMGVKLIDADDQMLAAIDRLPQEREAAEQVALASTAAATKREATMAGVGGLNEAAIPTPIVAVVPARERTVLGVSPAVVDPVQMPELGARRESSPPHQPAPNREPSGTREPSVVIDLVDSVDPRVAARQEGIPVSDLPTEVRRRGRGRWSLVIAFLVLAAVGAYAVLGADFDRLQRLVAPRPPPPPSASANPQESTAPTIVAWPNVSPPSSAAASASPSARSVGSASATPTGHAIANPGSASTSAASARSPTSTSASSQETPDPKKASGASSPAQPARLPKKPTPTEDNPY